MPAASHDGWPVVTPSEGASYHAGCLHSVNTLLLQACGAKDCQTFEPQANFCLATASFSGAKIFFNNYTITSN